MTSRPAEHDKLPRRWLRRPGRSTGPAPGAGIGRACRSRVLPFVLSASAFAVSCSLDAPDQPDAREAPALASAPAAPAAPAAPEAASVGDTALESLLRERLGQLTGPVNYFSRRFDLNGDGRPESIVYLAGPMVCGTGGCPTLVLAPPADGYAVVSEISVTRPPILAAASESNGWRDLIIRVAGGGAAVHDALLRHDGTTYPANPTVAPAEPVDGTAVGEVLIPEFGNFTEGQPLL